MPTTPSLAGLGLRVLQVRLMLRLLAAKGAMLRGGFGFAFQRAACPRGRSTRRR